MGRKAKEAATQKIGIWTNSSRRSLSSTPSKLSSSKENNIPSDNENRAPLQTQTKSAINSMKNCSVHIGHVDVEKEQKKLISSSIVEKVFKKDKNTNNKDVYDDFSFENDANALQTNQDDAMKDVFDKLVKQNKIVVKKYRAKGVKKVEKQKVEPKKDKAVKRRRRRDKQPAEIEPPLKKPNLRKKQIDFVQPASPVSTTRFNGGNLEMNNNVNKIDNFDMLKQTKIVVQSRGDDVSFIGNARTKLRKCDGMFSQSTPKLSTPLNSKKKLPNFDPKSSFLAAARKEKCSSFNESDVPFSCDFTDENNSITKNKTSQNKENSINLTGTSAAAMNRISSGTSRLAMNRSLPQISTPNINRSLIGTRENIPRQSENSLNAFSPTKRMYGRRPLKNITSEVNNTNATIESIKTAGSFSDSFGVVPRPSSVQQFRSMNLLKERKKEQQLTLPEAEYLTVRRSSQHQHHYGIENDISIDQCFGFDDDDDDGDIVDDDSIITEKSEDVNAKLEAEKAELKKIREKLKRFLHTSDSSEAKTKKAKKAETPKKMNKLKNANSPVKNSPKKIFGIGEAKVQKDIRSAFTVKSKDKDKSNENGSAALFEEVETVQDRRKSYSRPVKQIRKRRISTDSEPEEEEKDSDDDEYDEDGKKNKIKRRKKMMDNDPMDTTELDEFVKMTNAHFEDVDQFQLLVESNK